MPGRSVASLERPRHTPLSQSRFTLQPLGPYTVNLENAEVLRFPRSSAEHRDDLQPYASASNARSTADRWSATADMGEVDYESLPTNNLRHHLLAGAMAGMMEHCFVYPVDCVKVGITV